MSKRLPTYGDPPPLAAVMLPLLSLAQKISRYRNTENRISVFHPRVSGGGFTPRIPTTPDKIRGYFCAYEKYFCDVHHVDNLIQSGTCTRVSWYVYPR